MTPFRLLILLGVCLAWGMHMVVIKVTVGSIDPIAYAAIRMAMVAAILSPLLRWHGPQMPRIFLAGACFGGLNYAFMFSGFQFVPASVGAILLEMYVPFAMGFSVLLLGEKVGWRRIAGAVLALVGVIIIVSGQGGGHGAAGTASTGDRWLLGSFFIVMAGACEAMGAVQVKSIKGLKPLELLAWFAVVGVCVLVPMTLVFERDQLAFWSGDARLAVLGGLFYSVLIASIYGHASYYWLIQRVDVSLLAPAGLFTTVVAVSAGILLLGEPLTLRFVVGGLLTLTGVGIIVVRSAAKAAEDEDVVTVSGPTGARIQEGLEETAHD